MAQGTLFAAPVYMTISNSLDVPVRAGEMSTAPVPLTNSVDADLLQGLDVLADLLSEVSDTLNQGLLAVEDKLNALPIIQDGWVPIRGTRSSMESVETVEIEPVSQECVFDGVSVTILKLGAPTRQATRTQWKEWEYQLGYSRVGDGWALKIRTARFQPGNGNGVFSQFSDEKLLVQAPLDVRLKGIREITSLLKLLDRRFSAMPRAEPEARDRREAPQTSPAR